MMELLSTEYQNPIRATSDSLFTEIRDGDCRILLPQMPPESVHLIVTDPPYFLDGLDNGWRKGVETSIKGTGAVGGLPVGMKFDRRQGRALQAFMEGVGMDLLRVMKPGAFAIVFSQPRLSHRMAIGMEEAGFEIRDMYAWHFTKKAQWKAFGMEHFIDRLKCSEPERQHIKETMAGRKTAQLRPQFETMIFAQKPKVGTHVENWMKHGTGLMDATVRFDGKAPSTVMTVEKPARQQYNGHLTVKPTRLLEHLIEVFSTIGQVVLDPFIGSGSTAVAARNKGRSCIGMEINPEYVAIAKRRISERV